MMLAQTPTPRPDEVPPRKPLPLLLATIGALLLMVILGSLGAYYFMEASGFDALGGADQPLLEAPGRNLLRLAALVNNATLFIGTGLLALLIIHRRKWAAAAALDRPPQRQLLIRTALLFVVALPTIGLLAYLNLQVPLPEWMARSEADTTALLQNVLTMDSFGEFLLAFVTVGITPAIGEELLFRGVLQRRLLRSIVGPETAIWIAAFVFSAIHLEFAGFLPRLLLGALLGYSLYWSRSLWVPIILHLLFNGLQVITTYVTGEFTPDTEMEPWTTVQILAAGGASFFMVWLWRRFNTEYARPLEAS